MDAIDDGLSQSRSSDSNQSQISSEELSYQMIDSNDNSDDNTVVERRQCWLCLAQEEVAADSRATDRWLSPCRCRGSARWIHDECLQLWIDEKQKLDASVPVTCAQCNTRYVLVFPANGLFVDLILRYESLVNSAATYAMFACVAGALYLSAFSYGALTCHQILGAERTTELLETSSATLTLVGVPSIPVLLCATKLVNWETMVLRLWRRHYDKIPLLARLTGRPAEGHVRANMERHLLGGQNAVQIERENGVINHIEINVSGTSVCRAFCGALALPTLAKAIGRCLYRSVESDLKRTVLGGLTLIAVKGGLKIYLRQQQFIRQSRRRILNYAQFADPEESAH